MKYSDTLRIESDEPIDPKLLIEISNALEQQGIKSYLVDLDSYVFAECKKLLAQYDASYILSVERLEEAVLPKVEPIHASLLVRTLSDQLTALTPLREILIIDRYFFPASASKRPDYLSLVKDVFTPVINNITAITFITGSNCDIVIFENVKQMLFELNPKVVVSRQETEDFHDRFWIVDRARGMFVGTSLNGIGKKYALTDYLKEEDVATIVRELQQLSLISTSELN
jgi:hypothetical protein